MKELLEQCSILAVLSVIIILGNSVASEVPVPSALPGMAILAGIAAMGMALFRFARIKGLPAIVYISIIGAALTSPWSPAAQYLTPLIEKIGFLAIATPVLGCAGIGMAKEVDALKSQSGRMLIVSLLVFTGTFLGSALIAEILLRLFKLSIL
jgi:hypothetical protein